MYVLWATIFLATATLDSLAPGRLSTIPTILAALLFGFRGALLASTFSILAIGTLYNVTGTDTFNVFVRGSGPMNVILLYGMSLLASLVYHHDRTRRKTFEAMERRKYESALERKKARDAELAQIADSFVSAVHRSNSLSEVSLCTATHVSRALSPDFLAIAVADIENRILTVHHSIGLPAVGFSTGDVRAVSEALRDPLSSGEFEYVDRTNLIDMNGKSIFAGVALESGLSNVLVSNIKNDDDELLAQIWLGSTRGEGLSEEGQMFMNMISSNFRSAMLNARNSDSLKELQRYLVAQNEMLAQMQDGIENAEGELRLNNEQLQELNESKSQFITEVSHEIKSPLTVLIGYADLLRFDSDLDETQREYAVSIEQVARRLTGLIDDLGDLSKIESGKFTTVKENHDVVEVVHSVVEGMRIANPVNEARLRIVDEVREFQVEGDSDRLNQVFTNLVSNALKYSDENQPVEVKVRDEDGRLCVSVSDRGIGISEQDIQELFTPYFRTANPQANRKPGTGLGLFLSKSIVEEHGGLIDVSSRVGLGSTFSVFLPASEGERIEEAA